MLTVPCSFLLLLPFGLCVVIAVCLSPRSLPLFWSTLATPLWCAWRGLLRLRDSSASSVRHSLLVEWKSCWIAERTFNSFSFSFSFFCSCLKWPSVNSSMLEDPSRCHPCSFFFSYLADDLLKKFTFGVNEPYSVAECVPFVLLSSPPPLVFSLFSLFPFFFFFLGPHWQEDG